MEIQEKQCKKCKTIKHLSEFGKDKYSKYGRCNKCKICRNEDLREYNRKNPHIRKKINDNYKKYRKKYYSTKKRKEKYKSDTLKRTYGITLEEYNKMLEKQNNHCAICKKKQKSSRNKYFAVDHCHKTGKIRGLLCDRCNQGIGFLEDSIETLKSAILYLESYQDEHLS